MSTKHLTNPVTLTLELGDLRWLREFLTAARLATETDQKKVESMHTDAAIRAAKATLVQERKQLTKIIDEIHKTIFVAAEREAIAKRIAATVPGMPDISNTHPPLSKETEL